MTPVPTLTIGRDRKKYIVQLSEYEGSHQPRLLLSNQGALAYRLVLSVELPALDLRSFDADSGFRDTHALIRTSGEFAWLFQALVGIKFLTPLPETFCDNHQQARVCRIDTSRCLTSLHLKERHHG